MEFFLTTVILLVVLGKILIWKPKEKPMRSGLEEWDGEEFALDDPRIPTSIKARVLYDYRSGYQLFFADTKNGGEWWLMKNEELIGAYWVIE